MNESPALNPEDTEWATRKADKPIYQERLERENAAEESARAEFPGQTVEELYAAIRARSSAHMSRGRFKGQLKKMVRDGLAQVDVSTGKVLYKLTEAGRKRGEKAAEKAEKAAAE